MGFPRLNFETQQLAMNAILDFGLVNHPYEVCGLLIRHSEVDWELIQLENRSMNPAESYIIDPETVKALSIDHDVWENHVWVWHTHPSGYIGPSPGDLKVQAPNVQYLVVSIPSGEWRTYGIRSENREVYHTQQALHGS